MEDPAEERGVDAAARIDYQASADDNIIVDGVSTNPGSLGWLGFAFYINNTDSLKAFEVDDGESGCVAPTEETIADGSYPLSRSLYIYVNKAKAEENPALASFIDFYLSDDGKANVSGEGYVELPDERWEATKKTWEDEGTAGGDGDLEGEIVVSGSSTVEPVTAANAQAFEADNGGVAISVEGPGTGDGFQKFCAGETDISDASRPIKDEEVTVCEEAGIEFIELEVGIDGFGSDYLCRIGSPKRIGFQGGRESVPLARFLNSALSAG